MQRDFHHVVGGLPTVRAEGLRTLPAVAAGALAGFSGRSGIRNTSSARARLGKRRMKLRSSSAEISRWTPDLDLRSSASFISSKDGETPVSFKRSLMKQTSSCCFAVSIAILRPEQTWNLYGTERLASSEHQDFRRVAGAGWRRMRWADDQARRTGGVSSIELSWIAAAWTRPSIIAARR